MCGSQVPRICEAMAKINGLSRCLARKLQKSTGLAGLFALQGRCFSDAADSLLTACAVRGRVIVRQGWDCYVI